ncbi:META domain-containing protein [Shewanella sp. UCD-KL12]|uniref:META domain-containing protein n=1 Tax=Shewanella sp. UCD-KL12 TaxID=1917163 RepID=UPI00097038DD|nr:META domain-containing protein [Shewanella sp. UCD-KL12]
MQFQINKLALASSILISAFALQACNHESTSSNLDTSASPELAATEIAAMKSLDVNVIYLDRRMLPANAVLEVTLEDISRADAAADVISAYSLTDIGTPPYAVSIEYDASKILDRHRYSLRATIKVADSLVFTSTTNIDPFVEGVNQPIEIKLDRVSRSKSTQSENTANAEFTNTYWKLMSLADKPAKLGAGDKEVFIQFVADKNLIKGFSGCNNFSGSFEANQGKLTMGPVAGTRKMCMEGMEQELAFLKSIGEFASYSINGESLTVKSNKGELLATFESRYMN